MKPATPSSRSRLIALGSAILLIAAAFIAARMTADKGFFSFSPPATTEMPNPEADVHGPAGALQLYRTFYTAWATMILLFPALVYFWYRKRSETAGRRWLLYWTASYIVFLVHLWCAMSGFFGGDFEKMTHTSRVSAFWPDLIVAAWWGVDIIVAWTQKTDRRWIEIQRVIVHLAVFILFVAGSASEGEVLASKVLGYTLAATVLGALVRRYLRKEV